MRIVKVGVLAPTNKGIPLGVQGENRATDVEFDTRPWFREYPSGTVSAVAKRYGDSAPYPLTLDVEDGTAVWHVSDTDTAKAGEGAVELTMSSAGTRVRSLTFKTLVAASLTDAPVDDDAWYGWLDKAVVKVDETVQSAQRKMDKVDAEWTGLKADVTAKVEECGEVAAQAASDAHHAKVDAQATAKAFESAEGSVAKAEAAATRAEDAAGQSSVSAGNASAAASDAIEASARAAGWSGRAEESATNAYTSEANAALSASSAADSAEHATAQKVAAENAKDAAESFKAGAEAAKGEAAASASNAAASAMAAAKSESDAAASVDAINVIAPKIVETAGAVSYGEYSIAIGQGSKSLAKKSTAIGKSNVNEMYSTVIGYDAQCNGGSSDAIGSGASSIGNNSCSLGRGSSICATQGVVVGGWSSVIGSKLPDPDVKEFKASVTNSVAIGSFSITDENRVVSVGNETESITNWRRVIDDSGNPTEAAPYWSSETTALPKSLQHLKRRITNVADPIDWHNAANKNYVDTTTSNALVGTVSGKLLHVEDAWPSPARELVVYGKSEQDGTPTPDAPVPIESVGELSVVSTGKNLLPPTSEWEKINGYLMCVKNHIPAGTTVTSTYMGNPDGFSGNVRMEYWRNKGGNDRLIYQMTNYSETKNSLTTVVPEGAEYIGIVTENAANKYLDSMRVQVELGSLATDYSQYVGSTTPNLLVSDDGTAYELRSMPDGTRDEMVVKDGNRSIVKRVIKYQADGSERVNYNATAKECTFSLDYVDGGLKYYAIRCDKLPTVGSTANKLGCAVNSSTIYFMVPGVITDSVSAKAWLAENKPTFLLKPATQETIDLGQADQIKLPETISNVWIDANLTPECAMTYKKDVNVVIAGLTAQIAALNGNASNDDSAASQADANVMIDNDMNVG